MAVAGKSGSFAVGGVDYKFAKWNQSIDGNDPETTNFGSGGCYENVEGIHEMTVDADGPYDPGNMALTRGAVGTLTLRVSNSITFTVSARCKTIAPSQDVKDAARIKVTWKSTGTFTPTIT